MIDYMGRMSIEDRIEILEGVNLIAKFFSRNIAGYAILREAVTNNDIGRD